MITKRLKNSLFALALLAAACGQVVTPDYQGAPIATVSGQLTAETNVPLPETVHLAVAWYPTWLTGFAVPKAIITQEVTYRGAFPQRYTFDFYAPPPADALVAAPPGEEITGRAAMGFLLAYEDLNGNGQLDTIHADGTGGDRILGSSWDWHLDGTPTAGTPTGYGLFYIETAPENDAKLAAEGLQRGYNVIGIDAPVPLDTPIPIALTAEPSLALHICEEAFSGLSPNPCGIEIQQPQEPPPDAAPRFGGKLELADGVGLITAYVFDEQGHQITNAEVFVNATPIPYDAVNQQYRLENASLSPGVQYHLRAQLAGGIERYYEVTMPWEFSITSPARNAEVHPTSGFETTWTTGMLAEHYTVELATADRSTQIMRVVTGTSTLMQIDTLASTGAATLSVTASHPPETNFPSGFESTLTHTIPVTVVP